MLRTHAQIARALIPLAVVSTIAVAFVGAGYTPLDPAQRPSGKTMLILRGIASTDKPRGQLDDQSALEYARRLGYRGEVLDVAGGSSAQARMALDRIRNDRKVTALYGFSGGGYNARRIWSQLNPEQRDRIERVVIVGAPGVRESDFPGSDDVVIKPDPPAGHMAGPKALLDSLGPS